MTRAARQLAAQLRQHEESHLRREVRASAQALRSILTEDFVEIGSSGRIFDREAVIAAVSSEGPFLWRIDDFAVRVLAPDVALTTYRLAVWADSENDERITLRSSLWVQREGAWQLAFHQGTVAQR